MAAPFVWPYVAQNDRVIILGRSGTGKTVLAQTLLRTVRNAVIVDTKANDPGWEAVGPLVRGREIYKIAQGRYWWIPEDKFLEDDLQVAQYLAWEYKRKGRHVVYVDELLDLAPSANSYPTELKVIATRGRSAGVGLWTTTQRPVDVPKFALTEANHYFIFYLADRDDQQRAQQMAGAAIDFDGIKGNFGFYYVNGRGDVLGPKILDFPGNTAASA